MDNSAVSIDRSLIQTEAEMMSRWGNYDIPLTSINCITFNQEKYIRDALDGFLIQKTDFPFEILIHDDASTDKTADIIKEYEKNYPQIIKPIYQDINQYSQGKKPSHFNYKRAQGKYIAMCEGDDYWISPYKLQKQLDFLAGNKECSLCFHATQHVFESKPERNFVHRPKKIYSDSKFDIKNAILGGGGFMATNSMFFLKKHIKRIPSWIDQAPVGDLPLMLLLASKGRLGYIDKVMGVYRRMINDSWSSSMINRNKQKAHYQAILNMWDRFDEWSNYQYHSTVVKKKKINRWYYTKAISRYFLGKIFNG